MLNNSRKKICLTFDWELYFGTSGTPTGSQIAPTQKLLDIADEFPNLRYTFFIDVLHLMRCESIMDDSTRLFDLKKQIRDIVKRNHRIELHIHPHWLDAVYIGNGSWDFSNLDKYRIQNLSTDEINLLIDKSVNYLNSIARKEDPSYSLKAFRAGGWCIQPFVGALSSSLIRHNIVFESSVAYGCFSKSETHFFDFRNAPHRSLWRFNDDPLIIDTCGNFYECAISTYPENLIQAISRKLELLFYKRYSLRMGDGIPLALNSSLINRLMRYFKSHYTMFSIERISPKRLIKNVNDFHDDLVVLISNPKEI